MIKNVVFDFGQVIVHFEPSYMVGQFVTDPEDAALLETVVFDRAYWDLLDAGTISDEEVLERCRQRLPERLWDVTKRIYDNWVFNIPEIEGMCDLVKQVREGYGKRVFLLSNISKYFASHADEVPSLRLFEKCIFSSVCGHVKPNPDMFAYLCRECGILPEETIFIDDNPDNIRGAQACGITGCLFDGDVGKLQGRLETFFCVN